MKETGESWLRRWGPPLVMMVVIFVGSSIPGEEIPQYQGIWDFIVKKSGHLLEYGLLAALILRALDHGSSGRPAGRTAWLALALTFGYSLTDEFHQWFTPGRKGHMQDALIDVVGACIGVGLYAWIRVIRQTRSPVRRSRSNRPPA